MSRLTLGHQPDTPGTKGCIMNFAVWRLTNGEVWCDHHPCFNEAVTQMAWWVNDRLKPWDYSDFDRDFSPRVDRCRAAVNPEIEYEINQRLCLWLARDIEDIDPRARDLNNIQEQFLNSLISKSERNAAVIDYCHATNIHPLRDAYDISPLAVALHVCRDQEPSVAPIWHCIGGSKALLAFFDRFLDQWEKLAAEYGALGDLWTWEEYLAARD